MSTIHQGLLQHPTNVIFIDDDVNMLESLKIKYFRQFPLQTISSPTKAIELLEKLHPTDENSKYIQYPDQYEKGFSTLNIDLKNIHEQIYSRSRFDEVSTIVIDYSMPEMIGTELCRNLRNINPSFRLIMLTGDADEKIAVSAFNDNLIDSFVMKNDQQLLDVLEKTITEQQKKYFIVQSKIIIDSLKSNLYTYQLLTSDAYDTLLKKYFKTSNAVEYYITDVSGSLLFLDKQGIAHRLIIRTPDDMQSAQELAEFSDVEIHESILNAVKSRDRLLYTGKEDDFLVDPNLWEKYLYPAIELPGLDGFYYCYIEDPLILESDEIYSYDRYLKKSRTT